MPFYCYYSLQYQAQLAESKYHTLRITVWHRSRLGNAKLVAETNIPLSSVNHSDRMDHWFSLFQVSDQYNNIMCLYSEYLSVALSWKKS